MAPEIYKQNREAAAWKKPINPRKVEAPKATEFPKSPEDRFNTVLSIVNNEYKSATLGWFLDDRWRTKNDIRKIAQNHLLPSGKIPGASSFRGYIKGFIPIGVVAEEKVILNGRRNPVSFYRLTEDGEKYAKPIAQFALKTAVENGVSMYEVLGTNSSWGKTSSPYNRGRIILELEKKDKLTVTELANKLKLDKNSIRDHLLKLEKVGLLNYNSVSSQESGWSKYEWIETKNWEDIAPVLSRPALAKKVVEKIRELKVSDYNELAKILNRESKEDISGVLVGLNELGYVRQKGKLGGKKMSEISPTEKGRGFTAINTIFNSFVKDDLSMVNKEIEIFNDRSISYRYIKEAFKLYENVSPDLNQVSKEDNNQAILTMLENQGLRYEQIKKELGKAPEVYLNTLMERKEIIKEKEGKTTHYFLNPKKLDKKA